MIGHAPHSATNDRDPGAAAPWDTEAVVLSGADRAELLDRGRALDDHLARHADLDLAGLAFSLNGRLAPGGCRLALVAGSVGDLRARLARAMDKLADPACEQIRDTTGIYFFARPLGLEGQVAVLFPGEGAQYPGMLRDVAAAFPEAAGFIAEIDEHLAGVRGGEPAVSHLFLSKGDPECERMLRRLDNAMVSVLMADGALYRVLERLGLRPDAAAGHSMGEMAALAAAGCAGDHEAFLERFAATMAELERQEVESGDAFTLLAAGAGREALAEVLAKLGGPPVYLAMDNCPRQTVIVGPAAPMRGVHEALQARGVICERLGLRRPYHTPLFEPMLGPLRELFAAVQYQAPRFPVYSCTTGEPFPADGDGIRDLAVRHWAAPVRFTQMIENMHAAGVRLFIEVGPRGNLTGFVEDILRGRRFAALPANVARRSGLTQLNHLVAQLAAHHVPLDLPAFYQPRGLRAVELPWATTPPESGRGEVMARYLAVMEQFLDVQREVTEAFLRSPRRTSCQLVPPDLGASKAACPTTEPSVRPLPGDILRLVPGEEAIFRRTLDLAEDRFALDHTVGGRQISKVDPDQHGVPVVPMTFTLEMLAEAAGLLAPGHVVTAIRDIRLLRWLAYEPDEPSLVEVTARRADVSETGEVRVTAEVRELGPASEPHETGWRVARGTVVLAPAYPPAPPAGDFPIVNERPLPMTVEQVYHNLFHGPLFQGVRRTLRAGDDSIEAEIEVLPREGLFRSTKSPAFHIDPVMLDVVLHPLATWHLHQPDLAGRIMLPVGVEGVEFFGPPPPVGTKLTSRAWVSEANLRSFSHKGEAITDDGLVHVRLDGVKCWRFYVPFGDVNFHGPKDQYFLARRWTEAEARGDASEPFALVRLEVPPDLKQPAMNRVTAQVTLTPAEYQEFRRRTREKDAVHRWLFARIAAKDAIRLLWHDRTGERLFPADIECREADGLYHAHRRGRPDERFDDAVVSEAGSAFVALAAAGTMEDLKARILEHVQPLEASRSS
jgi:malonyl CoA-acyl carrier protein transacylase